MIRKMIHSRRGSLLMEYVVLNSLIGLPLVVLMYVSFYDMNEGLTASPGTVTIMGERITVKRPGILFKHYFQKILTGISLPLP